MNRRALLAGSLSALTSPALVRAAPLNLAGMRGTIDASEHGLRTGTYTDQTAAIARALDAGAEAKRPVWLPPGTYVVSRLALPNRVPLLGVPGTVRLVQGSEGPLLTATGLVTVHISGIDFEGTSPAPPMEGLLAMRGCPDVRIEACSIRGAGGIGLRLDRCGGDVEGTLIEGAKGLCALFARDSTGLAIRDSRVRDCSDGGILVHRSSAGEDRTIVAGNRIERIGAASGGTGQWGNGINIYRAGAVQVSGNHIADSAFTAVRCNAASNALITGNTCLRSGETGLYSEFGFQGAVVANNVVDGATIGISIANFMQGGRLATVANNVVRNLKTDGPYPPEVAGFGHGVVIEADTALTGNVIEGAPRFGAILGWGPYLRDVAATGNVVRDVDVGFAVSAVKDAGRARLSGNVISARGAAVQGYEWLRPVTGDLTEGGALPNLHLG